MYISHTRTIEDFTLRFSVFFMEDPDRICRRVSISKNKSTFDFVFPAIDARDLFIQSVPDFMSEVLERHMLSLTEQSYHLLSIASLSL